eukprot:18054-Rhodomonas_salina.1
MQGGLLTTHWWMWFESVAEAWMLQSARCWLPNLIWGKGSSKLSALNGGNYLSEYILGTKSGGAALESRGG